MAQSTIQSSAVSVRQMNQIKQLNNTSLNERVSGKLSSGQRVNDRVDNASSVVSISSVGSELSKTANVDSGSMETASKVLSVGGNIYSSLGELGMKVDQQINQLRNGVGSSQSDKQEYESLLSNFSGLTSGNVGGVSNPFNGSSSVGMTSSDGKSSSYTLAKIDSESLGFEGVSFDNLEDMTGLRDKINSAMSGVAEGMSKSSEVMMSEKLSEIYQSLSWSQSVQLTYGDMDISNSLTDAQRVSSLVDSASKMMEQSVSAHTRLVDLIKSTMR